VKTINLQKLLSKLKITKFGFFCFYFEDKMTWNWSKITKSKS